MFQRFEAARVLALVLAFLFAGPSFAVDPEYLGEIFPCRAGVQKPRYVHCRKCTESLLDIRLNRSLFESSAKQVSYGTTIQIDGLKDWTHGMVVDLAFAAHAKFVKQFDLDTTESNPDRISDLHSRKDRPTVTTTLVRDKVYLF
jgi:hypothetical protein